VEPRVEVIEGRTVRVIERTPPIPAALDTLLNGGRDAAGRPWPAMTVLRRFPLRLGGALSACMGQDHELADWIEGFHAGSDGRTRQLRLLACQACGAICVRDISVDTLPGLATGNQAPRRRDHILGWYTGSRPRQRVYT
jgi:hypothetical protein